MKVCLLILLILLSSFEAFSSVIPTDFKGKLEKKLEKQAEKIKKELSKKSYGQLQVSLEKIEQRNKLERMYGVDEFIQTQGDTVYSRYEFYSSKKYQTLFYQTIENRIAQLGGFQNYLQTTGLSTEAKNCRLKRGAIVGSGVVLAGVSIFGGVGLGMLGSALLSGSAVYLNPLSWTMVIAGVTAPAPTYFTLKKGYSFSCLGD